MRNNVIDRIPVSTKVFTYNSDSSTFIAEASDLRGIDFLGPIFNDAVDQGFYMKSHKTGRVVLFTCVDQVSNDEGEVTHWEYVCVTRGYSSFKAVIFND